MRLTPVINTLKTAKRYVKYDGNKPYIDRTVKALETFRDCSFPMYSEQRSYLVRCIRDISEFEFNPGHSDLNGKLLTLSLEL